MTVLITGGSGFVGLNIAEHLMKRGERAVLFAIAPPPETALQALGGQGAGLEVETGDVRDASALDRAMTRHGVDRIIHGAAITADLEREKTAARQIAEVNLIGTIEVLEAALRHKVRRVVQLSTGSIFGEAGLAAQYLDEQAHPPVPETLYGITKYAAERTGIRYRNDRGLDLVAGRLGNVFGRWEYETGLRDTLSLPLQLTRMAEAGKPALYPQGSGGDWVYAADVARAVLLLLDGKGPSPSPVYHIAAGRFWPLDDWAELLRGRYPGFECRAVPQPDQATVGRRTPRPRAPFSIARLRRDFGYEPAFDIRKSFDDFMEWREKIRI